MDPSCILESCLQPRRATLRNNEPDHPRLASFASNSRSACNLNPRWISRVAIGFDFEIANGAVL